MSWFGVNSDAFWMFHKYFKWTVEINHMSKGIEYSTPYSVSIKLQIYYNILIDLIRIIWHFTTTLKCTYISFLQKVFCVKLANCIHLYLQDNRCEYSSITLTLINITLVILQMLIANLYYKISWSQLYPMCPEIQCDASFVWYF